MIDAFPPIYGTFQSGKPLFEPIKTKGPFSKRAFRFDWSKKEPFLIEKGTCLVEKGTFLLIGPKRVFPF